MKKVIIAIVVVILLALGVYYFINNPSEDIVINRDQNVATTTTTVDDTKSIENKEQTVIGRSVGGRDILAYHYGTGTDELLLVGGIHGGYEWNTVLLAYEVMDYLKANPFLIAPNLKVTIIPVLNPDGLSKVVSTTTGRFTSADVTTSDTKLVSGRFNGNNVDLNRNFDCDWKSTGVWQSKTVSAGTSVFSEPESQAVKDYIESHNIKGAIVWYSAAGGVYSSNCHNGTSAGTSLLSSTYAKASGYPAKEEFGSYEITGDMTNWLAKKNIPAISVILTNHTETEWSKNKAGIDALLKYYVK